jgi:hypothetical protein
MKGPIIILCIAVCLLLALFPAAGVTPAVTCNLRPNPIPVTTYWPPGPDGSIFVETSPPGAIVYVNGDNKGHAPVTITNLWPGTYTITAELPGYETFTSITTIELGPTRSSVYCRLVPDSSGNGVYVLSTPLRAQVYLDGILKGETPLMVSNPETGTHILLIRHAGFEDWESGIEISETGTRTISAVLNQTDTDVNQGITVTSNPSGAKVILDSREKGITPLTLNSIAPGIHILELEHTGYDSWKSTVDVPETDIKTVVVNLSPQPSSMPGGIRVFSGMGNASVIIDGTYGGRTPENGSLDMDGIAPGEHTIVLACSGYKSYSAQVVVSPDQVSMVNVTLIPVSGPLATGALSVTTDPAGAQIFVDNNSVGLSPLTVHDIAVGDHLVTIQKEGYREYSASFLVAAGDTRAVSATLVPVTPSLYAPVFPFSALCALVIFCFVLLRKKY